VTRKRERENYNLEFFLWTYSAVLSFTAIAGCYRVRMTNNLAKVVIRGTKNCSILSTTTTQFLSFIHSCYRLSKLSFFEVTSARLHGCIFSREILLQPIKREPTRSRPSYVYVCLPSRRVRCHADIHLCTEHVYTPLRCPSAEKVRTRQFTERY
jgi:hypothetical protein